MGRPVLQGTRAISFSSLKDLHQTALTYAEDKFSLGKGCPPTWLIAHSERMTIAETPWEDDTEKYASTIIIERILQEPEVNAYAFIFEAWIAAVGQDQEFMRPSKMPDNLRDEVLIVQSFNRKKEFFASRFLITSRRHGPSFLGPQIDETAEFDQYGGDLWNLFEARK